MIEEFSVTFKNYKPRFESKKQLKADHLNELEYIGSSIIMSRFSYGVISGLKLIQNEDGLCIEPGVFKLNVKLNEGDLSPVIGIVENKTPIQIPEKYTDKEIKLIVEKVDNDKAKDKGNDEAKEQISYKMSWYELAEKLSEKCCLELGRVKKTKGHESFKDYCRDKGSLNSKPLIDFQKLIDNEIQLLYVPYACYNSSFPTLLPEIQKRLYSIFIKDKDITDEYKMIFPLLLQGTFPICDFFDKPSLEDAIKLLFSGIHKKESISRGAYVAR
ncbi:MAG: hypothetical protein HQK65_00295 [Desulfamplus sp.]|nr:hypothetical protein [Desulfamplus sp.]